MGHSVHVRHLSELDGDRGLNYGHSPHLAQWPLYFRLVGLLRSTLRSLAEGLPLRVLEIGAGHGGYTAQLLAAGCEVTAVEMSARPLQELQARYGGNERLTTVFDPAGALTDVAGDYALVLCVSVLHHVPDYLALLDRVTGRLRPGGSVLTLQDPLWYPRVGRLTRTVDRGAYLAWRAAQGDVRQGLAALARRARRVYPETRVGEIGYYHVVRQGVDESAVGQLLSDRFTEVELLTYWSSHLAAAGPAAGLIGLTNTFAVRATGRIG